MDGFDGSASPAVCRRVPGIRPKRKFLALSNLKGIEWNSLWLAEVSAAVCLFSQSVLRHWHGPLLRQSSSYLMYCRTDWATGLTAVSGNCS